MNDEGSLASSYYEIIEGLSVIWEETSQDLCSIVTNPKHLRRLSNGPLPYPAASPRLSPRSVEGRPRITNLNIKKSPLLKKNVITRGQAPICESEELKENNNDDGRVSVLVTSLRTGELIALPLQDDEYTFESCTTGSDMQSVESIEEYLSDEEQPKNTKFRENQKEEPTEDEKIFEIVDDLKEELLMIKHARDEAMKALYLHESSSPTKTQRTTISRSEEFLSRLSTTAIVPYSGNIGEITDSSPPSDTLSRAKEASLDNAPIPSVNANDAKTPLPNEVPTSPDPSPPESPAIRIADAPYHASLPEGPSTTENSAQQGVDGAEQFKDAVVLQQNPTTSSSTPDVPQSALDSKKTSGFKRSSSGEHSRVASCPELTEMTNETTSQEETHSDTTESEASPTGPISPKADEGATSRVMNVDINDSSELQSTLDSATNFTLMKKWLQSNLQPSFFDVKQRQVFRTKKIDALGGQGRRVQYNSSRLLLKKRLRKHLKAQTGKMSAQSSHDPPYLLQPNFSDEDSIDVLVENPQDDCSSLPGRPRRLRRSSRRRSESDLRNIAHGEKKDELRSKLDNIEGKLERILMNLSTSFSSLASLESGDGDRDVAETNGGNQRRSRGLSSRSFSEGMLPLESPPKERKGLKGRLERIRGEKKMNLEKLQHALDSAMAAISSEIEDN